jgi:antirestriction protein ArdC
MLMMQGMDKGYADPRWLTFKQAASLGGGVAKAKSQRRLNTGTNCPFIAAGMLTSPSMALG